MKRLLIVLVALLATSCNSHHVKANPTVNADEQRAQAIVQHCASHANFLTKPGRKSFYACVAPPGQAAAVQACATKALAADGVLTHSARAKFEADVAKCILPATPAPVGTVKK